LQNGFNQIELDAANIKFDSVKLESNNKDIAFKTADDKIYLTLDKSYAPNETISLRFKYSARPRKGVYFVEARTEGRTSRSSGANLDAGRAGRSASLVSIV
jgi:hypothetical protein